MKSLCRDSRRTPGTEWWCPRARRPQSLRGSTARSSRSCICPTSSSASPARAPKPSAARPGVRRLHQVGNAEVGQGRPRFGRKGGVRIAVTKRCLSLTIAASICIAAPLAAQAQAYPTRPVRSIMTVAGGADIVARLVAQGLTVALGQPVVVEAQSGAGGAIGAESVARAAPDGYTIMLTSASALVMNRFLSRSARLDPLRDFTPITKAFETVALVVTSPALPVESVRDLLEYAKRHPGKLSYGTSGIGTTHHLSGESIRLLTGIDWVHVPYKGGPPVITDLIGGEIQVGFSILATAAPFLASGKIRVLAVNGAKDRKSV